MESHRSTHSQWTFVADAPRYYDLTKRNEENDHLIHAWFDRPDSQSTLQQTKQAITVQDTPAADLFDDGNTLDYDDQPINYTADVYFNSPSHRRSITKRRDIKTELSRTRQEQTQHLQDNVTMEFGDLDDEPSNIQQLKTPQPGSQHGNHSSMVDDGEHQQRIEEDEDEDGNRFIKLPLLGRVIISPKTTSSPADSAPRIHKMPGLSPVLGTTAQTHWAEKQASASPPWTTDVTSFDDKRDKQSPRKPQFSQITEPQSASPHELPPLLRKRLYSDEPETDQPAFKKRTTSPERPSTLEKRPSSTTTRPSPLLQLIAQVKAFKQSSQQPSSPLIQLIARVKSFKRHHRTQARPLSWKTESVVERAKRVIKEAHTISRQLGMAEQQQLTNQRRLTTTSALGSVKRHDRHYSIPPVEHANDEYEHNSGTIKPLDDELIDNKHPSGSAAHSFISPYLPVALTVPRSPKFSSEKRSRRW